MRPNLQLLLMGAAGLVALAIAGARASELILYNETPSMPVGFYARSHEPIVVGSIVTIRAHDVAHDYAMSRGAGADFRLLKRIAATPGNIVCADGEQITIDGELRALRRSLDRSGRELPTWSGCHALGAHEYLVLGDSADSFDGRYFGAVTEADIEGVWRPILKTQ